MNYPIMNFVKEIGRPALLAVVFAAAVLSSCIKPDDIRIVGIDEFEMLTMTKPVVTIRVRNDSRRTIEILSGRFALYSSFGKVGDVMLTETVTVPKKSETSITIPMRVRVSNPLAAAALVAGNRIDADNLRITGEAEVKAGSAKRNFTVTDAPVSKFLGIFDTKQPKRLGYE